MKIVGAIFEKMKILIFFLCKLPLILGVDRKQIKKEERKKKGDRKYLQGGPRYRM